MYCPLACIRSYILGRYVGGIQEKRLTFILVALIMSIIVQMLNISACTAVYISMVSPVSLDVTPAEAGEFNKSMAGSPANHTHSVIICAVTRNTGPWRTGSGCFWSLGDASSAANPTVKSLGVGMERIPCQAKGFKVGKDRHSV